MYTVGAIISNCFFQWHYVWLVIHTNSSSGKRIFWKFPNLAILCTRVDFPQTEIRFGQAFGDGQCISIYIRNSKIRFKKQITCTSKASVPILCTYMMRFERGMLGIGTDNGPRSYYFYCPAVAKSLHIHSNLKKGENKKKSFGRELPFTWGQGY